MGHIAHTLGKIGGPHLPSTRVYLLTGSLSLVTLILDDVVANKSVQR